jgi:4-amino-4-deoxy-L-arabinose transferase-like glycosyltransferase
VLALVQSSAKRPWSDEGWFASPALNLAYHGFMGTTVLYNRHLPRIQQHTYWILPLYLVSLAAWFKVTGFGLVSMRMLSAVFGAVAIGSWYAIAQKLTRDPLTATLTAVLLSTDYLFVNIGTLGRPDMMCAGWGSLALALYLCLRERGLRRAFFWANVAMACCFFTHPNAILFAVLFVLLVWLYDRKNLRIQTLLIGALPYLAGAAMWLVYIGKDTAAFRAQLTGNADQHGRFGNFFHPLIAMKAEIMDRYLTTYGLGPHEVGHTGPIFLKAFVLVCYFAAILLCLIVPSIRSRPGTKLVLAMLGIVFLIQCFFNQKLSWYLAHIIPLYTLVLAIAFVAIWHKGRFLRLGAAVVFLVLLGVQVGGSLYLVKSNTYRKQYIPLMAFLNRLPPQQSIDGSAAIEFGLQDRERLLDDVTLGYYTHRQPNYVVMDSIYEEALEGLKYNDPTAYKADQAKLKSARKVYDQDGFQVYALQ